MKKTKLLFLLFSVIFLILGCLNFVSKFKATTINTSDLITVEGAQIRTIEPISLRFVGSVDSSYDTSSVSSYGIAIAFGDVDVDDIVIDGQVNGKDVLSAQVSRVDSSNYFYISVVNIPEDSYGQDISARAFVVDSGEVVYSSSKTTRSLGQTAVLLKKSGYTDTIVEKVITTLSEKYKKTFVDNLGSVYFDNPLYETNHKILGKLFIEDWNTLFNTTFDPETAYVLNSYSSPFSDNAKTSSKYDCSNSNLKIFFQDTDMQAKWKWLLDYINTELTDGTGYSYVAEQINLVLQESSSSSSGFPSFGGNFNLSWNYGANLISYIMSIFNAQNSLCGSSYEGYDFEGDTNKAAKLGNISSYNNIIFADLSSSKLVYVGTSKTLPLITEKEGYCGVYYNDTTEYNPGEAFIVPSTDSILVITYIDESEVEYSISYELNGGSWGYLSKNECVNGFIQDFYTFVSPTEDFNTFAYGESTTNLLGSWNSYIGGAYTGTNKLLYNNDLTADNESYFFNSSTYKEKWAPLGEWIYNMNERFGGTSYYGGTADFYRYIIDDAQGYEDEYNKNYNYFNEYPSINVSTITSYKKTSSDIALPIPLSPDFIGWYTSSDFSGSPVTVITAGTSGNLVFYAKWTTIAEYTITFDSNGGTEVDSISIKANESVTLPTTTQEGYEFLGWSYNDELVDNTFTFTYDTDITLIAKWEEIMHYTITFDSDGGTEVDSITVEENQIVTLPSDITKDGWTFTGWYYNDVRLEYTFTYTYETDITLVAKWTEIVTYTITFDSNGGDEVSPITVKYYEIVTLPTISQEGYEFLGWSYNDELVGNTLTYTYSEDITLIAKWERIYTITFDSNGGTEVESISIKANESVTLPTTTQEGYEFLGWYYNDELVDNTFTFTYDTDITLVAKWSEIVTYEITFDSDGGTEVDPITVEPNDTVTLPTDITKSGYTFLGWYYNDTKLEETFIYTYTESITITAKWQKEVTLTDLSYDGTTVKYRNSTTVVQIPTEYVQPDSQLRAAWVTSVAGNFNPSSNQSTMKNNLQVILDIFDKYNLNCMIFHIRAMNDAYYKTELSPINSSYGTYSTFETWDYLTWLIDECHKRDIEFHAWLNPYRIKSYGYASTATEETVAATYSDYPKNPASNSDNILMTYRSDGTQGAILNPAKKAVQDYIVDVCLEVMQNYDVDAIHFDDYFYAQMSSEITVLTEPDQDDYEAYISANPNCGYSSTSATNKKQWRRDNVDNFIYKLSVAMTDFNIQNGRGVQLGIAPTGIYKNGNGVVTYDSNGTAITTGSNTGGQTHYESYLFCDTKKWIDEEWIDYIMPQSYWAFTHTAAGYADVMDWWNQVVEYKDVNLYSGLGIYMSISGGNYSWGAQAYEVSNQVLYTTKLSNVKGVSLYSYGSLNTIDNDSIQVAYPGFQRLLNEYWTEKVPTPLNPASQYIQ